jgi:hypothetical protein
MSRLGSGWSMAEYPYVGITTAMCTHCHKRWQVSPRADRIWFAYVDCTSDYYARYAENTNFYGVMEGSPVCSESHAKALEGHRYAELMDLRDFEI